MFILIGPWVGLLDCDFPSWAKAAVGLPAVEMFGGKQQLGPVASNRLPGALGCPVRLIGHETCCHSGQKP